MSDPESQGVELTFGECEGLCGGMVERVGWDRYCYRCQDEMRQEAEEAAFDTGSSAAAEEGPYE